MSKHSKEQYYNKLDLEEMELNSQARERAKKEARHRVERRGAKSSSILRMILVGIVVLIQLAVIIALTLYVSGAFSIIHTLAGIVGVFVVLFLFGREWNQAFKLPWIMFILVTPVVGMLLYVMLGRRGTAGRRKKAKYAKIRAKILPNYCNHDEMVSEYKPVDPELYHQLYYLNKIGGYPAYRNTDVTYYAEGKDGLAAQIEAMKKAEKFILFEYHAIENSEAFEEIKKIMFEKVKQGVEVRVFYDDMGSIGFLNRKFRKEMRSNGVQCRVFNPLTPLMVFFMNNRDHRKITVIDGKVGFTGGYNMADEYFDITHPYGEWKDTGIKLEGEAVNSLSLIFLENWNGIKDTDSEEDIKKFLYDYSSYKAKEPKGVILPYADGPIDNEPLAETAYMNMLRDSKHYAYISTPYLLLTDEMTREMVDAAKRGVDVRIVIPGIPDKKMVYKMSRSYIMTLAKGGVKVYEYKPGFVHAKMCLVDDHMAIVGTINFDYRSLYHHFENGCLFSGYECLPKIREDFEAMFEKSRYVSDRHAEKKHLTFFETVLRLFSPLM